jgi:hypothetical protein
VAYPIELGAIARSLGGVVIPDAPSAVSGLPGPGRAEAQEFLLAVADVVETAPTSDGAAASRSSSSPAGCAPRSRCGVRDIIRRDDRVPL